jgi:hypothetical protein
MFGGDTVSFATSDGTQVVLFLSECSINFESPSGHTLSNCARACP